MAITQARPAADDRPASATRGSNVLSSPWFLAAIVAAMLVAFGWAFLRDPTLSAPTRDPAWYTWRASMLLSDAPKAVVEARGPFSMFSGGYRVTSPVLGAELVRIAGVSRYTWTIFVMVGLPLLASLALAAFAWRHRRDRLLWLLTLFASGALFLTTPFVGYMDDVMCLYLLALTLPFVAAARTSWGARSAVFLLLFTAALTHPTTTAAFGVVLLVAAGLRLLTSRFRFFETLRNEGPALVTAGLGAVSGLAMWKVGIWGVQAKFSDAALPPPYPASFFRARLAQWVVSMRPAIVGPLVAIALVWIVSLARERRGPIDEYPRLSALWLLPLLGALTFLVGITTPYYRFMNTTLAILLLAGMGAWVTVRWALARPQRWVGTAGVVVVFVALGWVFASGWGPWNNGQRWLPPDTRVALASVRAYVDRTPSDQPVVFVIDPRNGTVAWGHTKLYSNTAKAGLSGDDVDRSFVYVGSVTNFVKGVPTITGDPIFDKVSRGFTKDVEAGLKRYRAPPVAFVLSEFNETPDNKDLVQRIGPARTGATLLGPDVTLLSGSGLAPPQQAAISAARAAGTAEAAALANPSGRFADPLHLLRVLLAFAVILVVPGAIAMRWFELEDAPSRVALIPGISIALLMLSGIAVLAVHRAPFSTADGGASVVLAIAIAVVLAFLARRRAAGRAVVVPFVERALSLFSNRSFGFLMGAVFLAVLGDGIVQGSLAKVIAFGGKAGFSLDEARSPHHILALVLLTYLPYTFISPFMGALIDRFDRRALLFVANGARAVIIVLVGLVLLARDLPDPVLIGALLLTLASTRLVLAIKSASIPSVLSERNLLQGNSIAQAGQAVFQIVGAGIALVVTKLTSAGVAVIGGAIVYGVGAWFASRTRDLAESEQTHRFIEGVKRILHNIREGIGEVARRPVAKLGLSSFLALRGLVSFVALVFALEVRQILGGNSSTKALVIAAGAGALGAAIGFVAAQTFKDRVQPARLVFVAFVVAGVGSVLFGGITKVVGLSVVALVAAFAYFLGKISVDTLMQQALADRYRGRGFSFFDIAYNLAWILPALVLYGLWSAHRARALTLAAGALFLLSAAVVAVWSRRLAPQLAEAAERQAAADRGT